MGHLYNITHPSPSLTLQTSVLRWVVAGLTPDACHPLQLFRGTINVNGGAAWFMLPPAGAVQALGGRTRRSILAPANCRSSPCSCHTSRIYTACPPFCRLPFCLCICSDTSAYTAGCMGGLLPTLPLDRDGDGWDGCSRHGLITAPTPPFVWCMLWRTTGLRATQRVLPPPATDLPHLPFQQDAITLADRFLRVFVTTDLPVAWRLRRRCCFCNYASTLDDCSYLTSASCTTTHPLAGWW